MAEVIAHTPYEWSRWRGRVVLFKRVSLKPLWGLCIFAAGYFAVLAVLMVVLMFMQDRYVKPFPSLAWFVLVALIFIAFAYAFVKVYRSEKGYLLPVRVWRIGCGLKLSCETLRIPQPTTMGGTLPGAPMRWLVIRKDGNKAKRIVQVYHDLDLLDVNLTLAELNPKCG